MPNPSMPCGRTTPEKGLTAVSGVACPQGSRPEADFYPFGHPTPYAYEGHLLPASEINPRPFVYIRLIVRSTDYKTRTVVDLSDCLYFQIQICIQKGNSSETGNFDSSTLIC
jgi:hypothetical protein